VKYLDERHLVKILDEQVLVPAEALYEELKPRPVL
jgi:hypothetical protein